MSSNAKKVKLDGQFRRFEFVDEKSSKFWEIRVVGTTVDVRYGKIGTTGQKLTFQIDQSGGTILNAARQRIE